MSYLKPWLLSAFLFLQIGCAPLKEHPLDAPRESRELIDKGVAYLDLGDLERAAATFRVAYEIYPSAAAWDGLGCVAFAEGDYASAKKFFLEAIALNPDYSEALAHLALVREIEKLPLTAQALYKEALEKDPKNFRARNNLAASYADKERLVAARRELRAAETLAEDSIIEENVKRVRGQ